MRQVFGMSARSSLSEIALAFLRLGATAFGGPAAHIAMMEEEFVRRRKWLSREEFLDLLGITNLIPGPNSTEMAIHIGYRQGGWPGLIIAGACFILPAMLLVLGAAWVYVRYGALPAAKGLLWGVAPVILAVVAQALWGMGKTALKRPELWLVGIGSALAAYLGANELLILVAGGLVALLPALRGLPGLLPLPFLLGAAPAEPPRPLGALFGFFLKVGAVLYGSGYVLLAFLEKGLVHDWGWLTQQQLLDAVAVGQFTPGPVFTTATFIGYLVGGVPGGLVATLGIFLPAFVFVGLVHPLAGWLRRSPRFARLLDGVNAASLGLMAAVLVKLALGALVGLVPVLIALGALVVLIRWKVNSAWLVLAGGLLGLLVHGL
jgi:chromate transporter